MLIQSEQLLVVDHVALPLEQDVQAPIAEPAALMGDHLHPRIRPPSTAFRHGFISPSLMRLVVL